MPFEREQVFDAQGKLISDREVEYTIPATEQNRRTMTDAATAALANNRTFLALATPTAAQNAAQVRALTRQNNALIRLLLGLLEGTD